MRHALEHKAREQSGRGESEQRRVRDWLYGHRLLPDGLRAWAEREYRRAEQPVLERLQRQPARRRILPREHRWAVRHDLVRELHGQQPIDRRTTRQGMLARA